MTTKTITIAEDAYNILKQQKAEDQSFSEVIRNLAQQKGNASTFFGAWKDMDDQEADFMLKTIDEMDRISTKRLLKKSTK